MLSTLPLQGATASGIALLFGLLMFVVYVAIIVWTYNDAKQRATMRRSSGRSSCSSRRSSGSSST